MIFKTTAMVANKSLILSFVLALSCFAMEAQAGDSVSIKANEATYDLAGDDSYNDQGEAGSDPSFRASVGVGVISRPEFVGSDKNTAQALPMINISYGQFFLSSTRGLGYNIISNDTWSVAPTLNYRFGRDQDDSDLLRGLGDVDGGAELGGRISWHPFPVALVLDARHGLGQAKGYTLDLAAVHSRRLTDSLRGTVSLSTMYTDRKYNQDYFGITRDQSVLSGYRQYRPSGGIEHVAGLASLSWSINETFSLSGFGEYKKLVGPAADSPLVERGSTNQLIGGLTFNVNFGQ